MINQANYLLEPDDIFKSRNTRPEIETTAQRAKGLSHD